MAAERITEEEKNVLVRMRSAEAVYVLMSDFTRMPFVECDEETFDDEVFLYFNEEDAKNEVKRRFESGDKMHIVKVSNEFLLTFYTSLYPMGVNCLVTDKGLESEQAVQLEHLVVRSKEMAEKEGKIVVENPELHLTALYFVQKLRAQKEPKITEELQELNEEMMAHYMRGQYIVALTENNAAPILKQKDGKVLQPIFTDIQEFMKFQSVNKNEKFKTAVVEVNKLLELIVKEAIGITVNPFGVNLVLQLPKKAND